MTTQPALDPNLSAHDLWVLVQSRPDLYAAVAAHPNAYPELLQYLSTLQDPLVLQALVDRGYFSPGQVSTAGFGGSGPLPAAQAPVSGLAKIPVLGWFGIAAAALGITAGALFLLFGGSKGEEAAAPPPAAEVVEEELELAGLPEQEAPVEEEEAESEELAVPLPAPVACPPGISVPPGIDVDLVCGGVPAGALTVTAEAEGLLVGVLPSGNIGCEYSAGHDELACKIGEKDWPDIDVGHGPGASSWCAGFNLEQGGQTRVHCGTDSPVWARARASGGAYQTMEYGNSYLFGRYACNSAETGLTCWDPQTAHGFFLSRASWEEW